MDIEQIMNEWKEDSVIDPTNIEEASLNTPKLHAKYLRLYTEAKMKLKKAELDQKKLLKLKWLWYNGKMDEDQMYDLGWNYDPFDGLRVLKGDMEYYFNSDDDIQKSETKVAYYKQSVETLKEILDNIRWRAQTIRNIIELRKFENGVF